MVSNVGLNLFVKRGGKNVLSYLCHTKPPKTPINFEGLRYAPAKNYDFSNASSINTPKVKTLSYKERQCADILQYGEMKTESIGISKKEINEIVPFRRLSKKPAKLSDPEYFINQYRDTMKEYLGRIENFDKLPQTEQIDRIVKYRYGRLVANKIMNRIYKEPIEYHYSIGENGTIMAKDIGNETEVLLKNAEEISDEAYFRCAINELGYLDGGEMPVLSVHNHPMNNTNQKWETIPETIREELSQLGFSRKSLKKPFSPTDIEGYCEKDIIGYVVDMNGHKFSFSPNKTKGFEHTLANNEDFLTELKRIENTSTEEAMKYCDLKNKYFKYKSNNDKESKYIFLNSYIDYLSGKPYVDLLKKAEEKCGKFTELSQIKEG